MTTERRTTKMRSLCGRIALGSGLCFARLETGQLAETKRMLLLK